MPLRPEPNLSAQEMARRNNENQAVRRVALRRRRLRLKVADKTWKLSKKASERLDWQQAERDTRPIRAIGFFLPSPAP